MASPISSPADNSLFVPLTDHTVDIYNSQRFMTLKKTCVAPRLKKSESITMVNGAELPSGALEIIERMSDGLLAVDKNWCVTYVNQAMLDFFGVTQTQVIGRPLFDIFPSKTCACSTHLERAFAEQTTISFDQYISHRDAWIELTVYPSSTGLTILFKDITAHRHTANQVLQHYTSLFDQNSDPIYLLDSGGRFTSVNQAFLAATGYLSAEIVATHYSAYIPQELLHIVTTCFSDTRNGEPRRFETKFTCKDGRTLDVDITQIPVMIEDEVVGVYGIAKDVTEKKHTEQQLQRNRQILAHAQSVTGLAIWEFDPEGRLSYWSDELFTMYGLENTGHVSYETIQNMIHPDDRQKHQEAIERMYSGTSADSGMDIEFRIFTAKGQMKYVQTKSAKFVDEDGHTHFVGTALDISAMKRTQELLAQNEKLTAVGQLAAGIAHEIRNPLTSLKGFLKLVSTDGTNRSFYEIMASELERIESITSEMLVLSRPHTAKLQVIDLAQKTRYVMQLLEALSVHKSVSLILDTDESDMLVEGVSNQLEQVVFNIIKNAIEACSIGGTVKVECRSIQRDRIEVRVTDDGPGIPVDIIQKLGEPFFTTKEQGTGLGIMVSKKIVLDHKGVFLIENGEVHGATVTIQIPCKRD